jgi:hypothetical protein
MIKKVTTEVLMGMHVRRFVFCFHQSSISNLFALLKVMLTESHVICTRFKANIRVVKRLMRIKFELKSIVARELKLFKIVNYKIVEFRNRFSIVNNVLLNNRHCCNSEKSSMIKS